MEYKNRLAILLLLVFIGKLISIDAKFIEFTTDTDFVAHINPYCKKVKVSTASTKHVLTLETTNIGESHSFQYVCTTPYNLRLVAWETFFPFKYQENIKYISSGFSSNYSKKLYPPPQLT